MTELIVGGTSGLGLELARLAPEQTNVIITGRHDPQLPSAEYRQFDLSGGELPRRIGEFVSNLPQIDSLYYVAGTFDEGHITDLGDEKVDEIIDVHGRGLIFFVKKLLEKQRKLSQLTTITSTSQWVPRELEPVYNFAKAGAGHLSNGLSLDPAIGKTLVVGPSGMRSNFWNGTDRDTSKMLEPSWVAEQVRVLEKGDYKYCFAKILGEHSGLPKRVEITEVRA